MKNPLKYSEFVETCLLTSTLLRQLPQMEVLKGIDIKMMQSC
jgi:hypothetical protein